MNELRNDETLTTADLVNPARAQAVPSPRQAYSAAGEKRDPDRADPIARNLHADPATPDLAPQDARPVESIALPAATQTNIAGGPLFPEDELHNFRARWDQVQTSFVDEPRQAVEQADSLVANVVKRLAEQFASERENLEKQWDRGDTVNTEDLRQALKRYRAFFDRLLSL